MDKNELKEVITMVIQKIDNRSPEPACGLFFTDEPEIIPPYGIVPIYEEEENSEQE